MRPHPLIAAMLLVTARAAAAPPHPAVTLQDIVTPHRPPARYGLNLGQDLAISGATLVTSEPTRTVHGQEGAGQVLVYLAPGGAFGKIPQRPTAILRASDAKSAHFPFLGYHVAIDGDVVVAGAAYAGGPGAALPEAYVFVKPATGWADATETARLQSPSAQYQLANAGFVAIQGDTIVVGCLDTAYQGIGNAGCGAVYVKPPGGWKGDIAPVAVLTDGGANDSLGAGVAISGDTIALSAPEATETSHGMGGYSSGAVQIYEKPAGGWVTTATPTATLLPSDPDQGTFGYRIALDGDTLVSGCPYALVDGLYIGAAYVYVRPGAHWVSSTQTAKLSDRASGAMDGTPAVGIAVAVRGGVIAAGANGATPPNDAFYGGEAYLFHRHNGKWADAQKPDATAFDPNAEGALQLGISLALTGGTLLAGAEAPDADSLFQGAVYVFGIGGM